MLLDVLFRHAIERGRLTVLTPDGRRRSYGRDEAPAATIRLKDGATARRIALDPWLAVGECYMDGTLEVVEGDLRGLVSIGFANAEALSRHPMARPLVATRRLLSGPRQWNPIGRSRGNVAHHYDLSGALFALFLDPDMQYSCAYFPEPGASLAQAQEAKKRHIAAKLALADGQRVLDIGCGWGGLALTLAGLADVEVTGVTLSREQLDVATDRARRAGLADRVRFEYWDYREIEGSFDRIVSVGMFEHVGRARFAAFFGAIDRLLAPRGVALLHSIGRRDGPGHTNPWIDKYIFPGGYSPALSEVLPAVEATGLWVTDIEILRLHYAETLRAWHDAFQARRDEARALYDERFCRMWEFYLIGAEMSFRHDHNMVFQMQMAKGIDTLPITRDYMARAERDLARADLARAAADPSMGTGPSVGTGPR